MEDNGSLMCLWGGLTWYLNIDLIHSEQRWDHTYRRLKQGAQVLQKCPLVSCLPVPVWTSGAVGFRGWTLKSCNPIPLSLKTGQQQRRTDPRGQKPSPATTTAGPIFNSGGNCGSSRAGTLSMHSEGRLGLWLPPQSATWAARSFQLPRPPTPNGKIKR